MLKNCLLLVLLSLSIYSVTSKQHKFHLRNENESKSSSSSSEEREDNYMMRLHNEIMIIKQAERQGDGERLAARKERPNGVHFPLTGSSSSADHRPFTPPGKKRICELKYAEYVTHIYPNEDDTASDVNESEFDGRELAEPGEYPHMTALGYETSKNNYEYKCGGSLISENFVITAAHCTNFTGQQPSRVKIGDLNLLVNERSVEPQVRQIRRIFNHPSYHANSYYNDIALLQMDENVVFTEFVRPIRLWVHSDIPYAVAHAMGYGSTSFGKIRTNRLTDLNKTIVPNEICSQEMPSMPEAGGGIISSQICAKDYVLNRDTCQGDSGGPLQLNLVGKKSIKRRHYQLIGITSYGVLCRSQYPSVYTRVSAFLDWIEQTVWAAS